MSPHNLISATEADDGISVALIAGVCSAAVLVIIIVIVAIVMVKKKQAKVTNSQRWGTPTGSYQNTEHFY